ncbi:YraN family protein [Kamptonema animale CS-326]|jgi:putative endonuclease|uniref:YraN family protein n=1 Tax=Kamptonema animale TaxID=92934 RepID=UPI00232B4445|nr:YraN family protein [Kamptonema animale]MDB9510438.1 YraN family protein [Kamptonema animale CS-326]
MGNSDLSTFDFTRKGVKLSNDLEHPTTADPSRFAGLSSNANNIGNLGENLVAQWLEEQGWEILHRRWRCRYGEIDTIAIAPGDGERGSRGEEHNYQLPITHYQSPITNHPLPTLIFVEVKTRRRRNWDADGMLAVNATKQAKLWQTAEIFLSDRPELADYPCRFDVALVCCEPSQSNHQQKSSLTVAIGEPVIVGSWCLTLQEYIQSAFSH